MDEEKAYERYNEYLDELARRIRNQLPNKLYERDRSNGL